MGTHSSATFDLADEHAGQEGARIVRVAHVLKGLRRVLSSLGQQHLVATRVLICELADVVDWHRRCLSTSASRKASKENQRHTVCLTLAIDEEPEVAVGLVLAELLHGHLLLRHVALQSLGVFWGFVNAVRV